MSNPGTHGTRRTRRDAGFTFLEMVVVIAVIGILSAIALPVMSRALSSMRLNGAARSISNLTAATKTKAAANFTRARLFVDLGSSSYHLETWSGAAWVAAGAPVVLPTGVSFGWGAVAVSPLTYHVGMNQPPVCTDGATPPVAIGGSVCIVFNSRGIPVDEITGQPTSSDELYITDTNMVLGVTVSPTGLIGVWSTPPLAAPSWTIS